MNMNNFNLNLPRSVRLQSPSPIGFARVACAFSMLGAPFFAALCDGVAAATPGDPPAVIARDVLFGNPERISARVSPDGTRVSFIAPLDGVLNVWVAPIGDLAAAKPVTKDTDRGIRQHTWIPSGTHILYMQDQKGDENFRVYSVDLASGAAIDLTPFDGARGSIAHISRDFPDSVAVAVNNRDPQYFDVHLVNALTGERKLVFENTRFAQTLVDDRMLVRVVAESKPDGSMAYLAVDASDDATSYRPLLEVPYEDAMSTAIVGIDRSGRRAYLNDSRGRNLSILASIDLASGQIEKVFEPTRSDVADALVNPIDGSVEAVASEYLRTEWTVLSPKVEKDFAYLRGLDTGDFFITSRSLDDSKWTVSFSHDAGPSVSYLYDRAAGMATKLFTSNSKLEGLELASMQSIEIPSRDGLQLPSYLTLPTWTDTDRDGKPEQPLPTVLLVHGGPWARDAWGYNSYHQWLANRGYAVLSVNFRGSTGFGKEFVNKGDGQWADAMHNDLVDAVEWAVTNNIAQREKVAIMGGSYGGYAALAGVTFTPDLFAASVAIVSPSNLITLLESVPAYWAPMTEMFAKRVADKRTPEGRRKLRDMSPLTHVDEIKKPLLVGQGANDPRVKRQESDQIVRAMQAKNLPVTYVLFPDEGHGFAKPENNIAFNAVVEAFLAKHLCGRAEPIRDELPKSSAMVVSKGALDLPVEETSWEKVAALDAPIAIPTVSYESLSDAQKQMVDQSMQQLSQLPAEAMPDVLKQLEAGLKAAPAEFHPAIFHLIGKVKERMAAD
jgi:dipeptidyl aminopeptidase/acylaminoacyl peptidase